MLLRWELHTESNFTAFTEASAERRMSVINTSIDDTNLDSLPFDARGVDFIDTSHSMRSIYI